MNAPVCDILGENLPKCKSSGTKVKTSEFFEDISKCWYLGVGLWQFLKVLVPFFNISRKPSTLYSSYCKHFQQITPTKCYKWKPVLLTCLLTGTLNIRPLPPFLIRWLCFLLLLRHCTTRHTTRMQMTGMPIPRTSAMDLAPEKPGGWFTITTLGTSVGLGAAGVGRYKRFEI